jgi:hypothetical protein
MDRHFHMVLILALITYRSGCGIYGRIVSAADKPRRYEAVFI